MNLREYLVNDIEDKKRWGTEHGWRIDFNIDNGVSCAFHITDTKNNIQLRVEEIHGLGAYRCIIKDGSDEHKYSEWMNVIAILNYIENFINIAEYLFRCLRSKFRAGWIASKLKLLISTFFCF